MTRSVLSECRATWSLPPVFVGDNVYMTVPVDDPADGATCTVDTPEGTVQATVRTRTSDLSSDYCAVIPASVEGRHRYTFTLPGGRKAKGSFIVHVPGANVHGKRRDAKKRGKR